MIKIRVPTPSLVRRRPIELPMYPGTYTRESADSRTNVAHLTAHVRHHPVPSNESLKSP